MDERNSSRRRLNHWLSFGALSLLAACAPLPVAQQADGTVQCSVGGGDGDILVQPCPVETAPVKPRKPARAPKPAAPVVPAEPPTSSTYDLSPPRESDQQGLASWYGPRFHGRPTASGERFDSRDLTAAHRTLEFGTRVCVRSSITGKTVVVRINDRGPFTGGRVIDLSQGAAEALGMIGLGIKPVELWQLDEDEQDCPEAFDDDNLDAGSPAAAKGHKKTARKLAPARKPIKKASITKVTKPRQR